MNEIYCARRLAAPLVLRFTRAPGCWESSAWFLNRDAL